MNDYDQDLLEISLAQDPIEPAQYYLDYEPIYWFFGVMGLITLCALYVIFG